MRILIAIFYSFVLFEIASLMYAYKKNYARLIFINISFNNGYFHFYCKKQTLEIVLDYYYSYEKPLNFTLQKRSKISLI